MTEAKQIGTVIPLFTPGGAANSTDSPTPSKPEFSMADLERLPDRLDNPTMRALRTFYRSELPPEAVCEPKELLMTLRAMVACLPRQNGMDELGGKLMAAMYQHQLERFSGAAITFLRDRVIAQCRWFPTVAECLEILTEYRRKPDCHSLARDAAKMMFIREDRQRDIDEAIIAAAGRSV
jgi:hypothetical protein